MVGANTIEGGCEDGFLSLGDDYFISNGSFLRLTEFRFRGGVTNQGEDIIFEFWDSTGTQLIDNFNIRSEGSLTGVANAGNNLPLTGTRDWTIKLDCWPNCQAAQSETAEQNPIIIPPNGYIIMRSPRTVGTVNGAAAFWSQTDAPADVGSNDNSKVWLDGDPNASIGTNVFIFELMGTKVADPVGACCDDAETCEDTVRWECGQCTNTESLVACASTLHDCPDGGLNNSFCQFDRWFGPTSHTEIEFGSPELTLCNGVSPSRLWGSWKNRTNHSRSS